MNVSISPEDRASEHFAGAAILRIGDHRPRIEKQQLHVENQEDDGDQIELDVEPLPGVADGSMPDS